MPNTDMSALDTQRARPTVHLHFCGHCLCGCCLLSPGNAAAEPRGQLQTPAPAQLLPHVLACVLVGPAAAGHCLPAPLPQPAGPCCQQRLLWRGACGPGGHQWGQLGPGSWLSSGWTESEQPLSILPLTELTLTMWLQSPVRPPG